MAVICGKQYGNLCGGIPHTDSLGNLYEVLGPGFSLHRLRAIAVLDQRKPGERGEYRFDLLVIVKELYSGQLSFEARHLMYMGEPQYAQTKAGGLVFQETGYFNSHAIAQDFGERAGRVAQRAFEIWQDTFMGMKHRHSAPLLDNPVEEQEHGAVVMQRGVRVYLDGPGYSTEHCMVFGTCYTPVEEYVTARLSYDGNNAWIIIYHINKDMTWRKTSARKMPIEQAIKTKYSKYFAILQKAVPSTGVMRCG